MNSLIKPIDMTFFGMSCEELLLEMAKHGSPMLTQMDSGSWWCKVSMRVASQGVSFDVKSDHTHKTPTAAAAQCLSRIAETLAKYGVKV